MHIRKDDIVEIITGDDKGKRGRVLNVQRKKGKVVVEGINRVYKHMRPSRHSPQGGRLSKEMPIALSNVLLVDPQDNRPTRVGVRYLADGSKERFSKRTGVAMGKVAPAREAYAE
jgi:large subunit ribosomal protein L24